MFQFPPKDAALAEAIEDEATARLVRKVQKRIREKAEKHLGRKVGGVYVKVYVLPQGMNLEQAIVAEAIHMMEADEEREATNATQH